MAPRVKKKTKPASASARTSNAPSVTLPPSLRPIVDAVVDMVFQRLTRERERTPPAPRSAPRSASDASGRAKRSMRKENATPGSARAGHGASDTQSELVGALADLLLSDLTRTTGAPKSRDVAKARPKKIAGAQGKGAQRKGARGKGAR